MNEKIALFYCNKKFFKMYKPIVIFKERERGRDRKREREREREGGRKRRKLFYAEEYQLIKYRRISANKVQKK